MLRIAISQDIQILKDFENQLVNSGIDIDFTMELMDICRKQDEIGRAHV